MIARPWGSAFDSSFGFFFTQQTKEEIHHYKMGFKLLWADTRIAWGLFRQILRGESLTRREHRQVRGVLF